MTLEQKIERAKQLRKMAMINAEALEDPRAAEVRTLYPEWKPGEAVEPGDRRYRPPVDTLYKVREGKGHTTQEGWEPENMADSWEAIDVEHAGTMEDPIPARPNMRYYPDRYYLDGGKLYKCTRDTGQAIAQLPHELVGVYFELVV
ncbi:MAG TPA: hypothetical protein IAC82_09320 [Candidatus Merdivicinus intestinigallinarum]|nr:hypothetical protein [Candidatus Merdivicinus intestinigallinarum]